MIDSGTMLSPGSVFLPLPILRAIGLLCWPVLLYAEMHYRPRLLRGRLFKKQPEILFDTPQRVQTEHLPVVLLVKDAHWFPIILKEVSITITASFDNSLSVKRIFSENLAVTEPWFTREYALDVVNFRGHRLTIDCAAIVESGGHTFCVFNDNYTGLSHAPFNVYADSEPLPMESGWQMGDLHCHSSWTSDQVEFGLPPQAIPLLAKSMGLSFCGLTEHSYDLDDQPDSWTKNDPQARKWTDFHRDVAAVNSTHSDFCILPGEEVSVDNGLGRNVHLAVLNNPEFFQGTGDGLERSLGFPSELSYQQVLQRVAPDALVFAAHPLIAPPFSQWLIARRGIWNVHDHQTRLDGWQILNGNEGSEMVRGRAFWICKLLSGSRAYIYAGNDAHGNFNRFRQVRIPLVKMYEHTRQIFGEFRTGVRTGEKSGADHLIGQLKNGPVMVTNGPFIDISIRDHEQRRFLIGQALPGQPLTLGVIALSTNYFGTIRRIKIYLGDLKLKQECIYKNFEKIHGVSRQVMEIPLSNMPAYGYFRAEIETRNDKFALTNPIWFGKSVT